MFLSRSFPGHPGWAVFAALLIFMSAPVWATNVFIQTPLGAVEVELFDDATPATVTNFLSYLNDGAYTNSFFHRSVPGFVVQGGGFTFTGGVATAIPARPPVINEPGISNLRGTVAMAKLGGDPNSATSQFFFNLSDNSANLDNQNGGFTVFAKVVGQGMEVIDAIAALPVWNAGAPFDQMPLIGYSGSGNITAEHLVLVDAAVVSDFPINAGLNDAWFNPATAGQGFFITVFPQIRQLFLAWFTYDTERPDGSISANLGEPGHRWLTAFGSFSGNSASLDIELTQGGLFNSIEPQTSQSLDGTIVLAFSDCENGTVTYAIPAINQQGVIPIQRIALDNVPRCEELATQATAGQTSQ